MLTMCRCYVQKEDQDTFRKYIRFSQIELNKKARNPVPEKDLPRIPWIVLPLEGKWLNDYENAYWLFLYRANLSWASDTVSSPSLTVTKGQAKVTHTLACTLCVDSSLV